MDEELLQLNQRLLDCISSGDWNTYQQLCDPALTAFEPEARGHRVEGLDFHRYYFDLQRKTAPVRNTITAPKVLLLPNDVAIVTFVRLLQRVGDDGHPHTDRFEETRVWQRQADGWKHLHFHRSANP